MNVAKREESELKLHVLSQCCTVFAHGSIGAFVNKLAVFISGSEAVHFVLSAECDSKLCRVSFIFDLSSIKWWTRGDLSGTGH